MFDGRIHAALSTEFELADAEGNVLQTAKLRDLELGDDVPVCAGKFYSQSDLGIHYYCSRIVDQMITWIVVENYQHGILFQATLQQKIEHSKQYSEVTNLRILNRLKSMLKDYEARNHDLAN